MLETCANETVGDSSVDPPTQTIVRDRILVLD